MDLLKIIGRLAPEIERNPRVHAMWIEGSYASGKNNQQSDIDVWLDVDNGSFERCLADFRQKLSKLVDIERETIRGIYSDSPKLTKQTFILRGYPPGQDIELDLQEHSQDFKFSQKEHTIKVLFDEGPNDPVG